MGRGAWWVLLAATLARAQPPAAPPPPPKPISATAYQLGITGFFVKGPTPFADTYVMGDGAARLEVTDKVQQPDARVGDEADLRARFFVEGSSYLVELTQVGWPARSGAPWQPIGGGVLLDVPIHGATGLGSPTTTPSRAAIAVWGIGRVTKDGRVLTEEALIFGAALSHGTHADEGSHRLLNEAREGDGEIEVLAMNLPRSEVASGFIQFRFDEVRIVVNGTDLPTVSYIPTVTPRSPDEGVSPPGPAALPVAPGAAYGGSGAMGAPPRVPAVGTPGALVPTPDQLSPPELSPTSPTSPPPANAAPAAPLPPTPEPANAAPAVPLPPTPEPANAAPAAPLPPTSEPANAAPAVPLPSTPAPANAAPATPLPPPPLLPATPPSP